MDIIGLAGMFISIVTFGLSIAISGRGASVIRKTKEYQMLWRVGWLFWVRSRPVWPAQAATRLYRGLRTLHWLVGTGA